MLTKQVLDRIRIEPGSKVRLKRHNPEWTISKVLAHGSEEQVKQEAKTLLQKNLNELGRAQELLYATGTHAILIILQAMDAAGKDGTIKHVLSGANPQGCQVTSFKQPSSEELRHGFLWRHAKATPAHGMIGIFNRSHYEEVLVVRVHPEWLAKRQISPREAGKQFWEQRYQDINSFERYLARNGTTIVKLFLHISKETQKQRFLERLENPSKYWKFEQGDLAERERWNEYMKAYEHALSATSTEWAPWYVIPADHKWSARVLVAEVITAAIQGLNLRHPRVSPEARQRLEEAKKALREE
jgi:PPK2 family polyphosphate:nucleotide phosphotransferase